MNKKRPTGCLIKMINGYKILAIIPARGGSKTIKDKNIYPLLGKPLIGWTIHEAQKLPFIDRLVCSTDSEIIASVAGEFKCDVPFIRPPKLSIDTIAVNDSLLHAIEWYENKGEYFDILLLLHCTSPFRTHIHIQQALKKFIETKADNLISLCEFEIPPFWAYTMNENEKIDFLFEKEKARSQRQNLPKTYHPNGAIYISKINTFKQTKDFLTPAPIGFVMDKTSSVDIDTENDINYAEFLLRENRHLE